MNIAVVIRNVVDCRVPLPADIYGEQPLSAGLMRIINPADWAALEQSLKIPVGSEHKEIMAVSLGDEEAEASLRWCLAAGAQGALRIWDEALAEADVLGRAKALAAALNQTKPDLILAGDDCLDQFDTLLPGVLAAAAGMAYVPGVTTVEKVEMGTAVVIRRLEKGERARVAVSLPALIAVENGGTNADEVSLPALIAAFSEPLPCQNLLSLGLPPARVGSRGSKVHNIMTRAARPITTKPRTPDPGLSAEQRLRYIFAGGMARKQGEVVTGSPEELADRIVQFLQNNSVMGL